MLINMMCNENDNITRFIVCLLYKQYKYYFLFIQQTMSDVKERKEEKRKEEEITEENPKEGIFSSFSSSLIKKPTNEYILTNFANIPNQLKQDFLKKLTHYKYVDELDALEAGTYIRWVCTKPRNANFVLARGAIFCEVVLDEKGLMCVCKNFNQAYFKLDLASHLIFQKLSAQEIVIAKTLETLETSNA